MPTRKPKPKRPTAKEVASYNAGYDARSLELAEERDHEPPPIKIEDVQREVVAKVLDVITTREKVLNREVEGKWFAGKLRARLDENDKLYSAILKVTGG